MAPAESVWCPRCGAAAVRDSGTGTESGTGTGSATGSDIGTDTGTDPGAETDPGSGWACPWHGAVPGLYGFADPSVHGLLLHLSAAPDPTWLPWPLPGSWSLSGVGRVVDRAVVATVLAVSGPDPLGASGDVVIVSEEPGVGLGARYAGLDSPDPGPVVASRPADARVVVGRHPTPLWFVDAGDDRQVCVGEASGRWLWMVAWPPLASAAVLLEAPALVDLHDLVSELEMVPLTGLSARLPGAGTEG